jgi:hypothetical protein
LHLTPAGDQEPIETNLPLSLGELGVGLSHRRISGAWGDSAREGCKIENGYGVQNFVPFPLVLRGISPRHAMLRGKR